MKLILFLAVIVAAGGIGYWFVTNNPGVVDSVREGVSQESVSTQTGSAGTQSMEVLAETRITVAPTAITLPTRRPLSTPEPYTTILTPEPYANTCASHSHTVSDAIANSNTLADTAADTYPSTTPRYIAGYTIRL